MVGSALKFLERFHGPTDEAAATKAAEPFAWVPQTARERARLSGIDLPPWDLDLPTPTAFQGDGFRQVNVAPKGEPARMVQVFGWNKEHDNTLAKCCNTLATRFRIGLAAIQDRRTKAAARDPDIEQWLVEQLQALHFATQYQYRMGKAQLVSVPVPKSIEACLAYALGVLAEDKWHFRDRVVQCPYHRKRSDKFEPDHWVFDVDSIGQLPISAPLKFCSAAHANAYRQRELRRRPKHK